jgi:hypothetical protein
MKTRSQSAPLYDVNIDFDEASKAWNANKKRVGQEYIYVCAIEKSNGKPCGRKLMKNSNECYHHSSNKR